MATNIKRIIYFHQRLDVTAARVKSLRSDMDMTRYSFDAPEEENWAEMARSHGYHACARTEMREPWFPDAKLIARAPNLLAVCSLGAGMPGVSGEEKLSGPPMAAGLANEPGLVPWRCVEGLSPSGGSACGSIDGEIFVADDMRTPRRRAPPTVGRG